MKILCNILLLIFSSTLFAAPQSPAGDWLGFYEDTEIPGAIVRVTVDKNGMLNAYYVELYPKANETIPSTCIDCPGSFKDRPLKNIPMLWDLKYKDGKWEDGKTLSLERRQIFDASAWLSEDGNTLFVRGSLGFLSKTQSLQRLTSG